MIHISFGESTDEINTRSAPTFWVETKQEATKYYFEDIDIDIDIAFRLIKATPTTSLTTIAYTNDKNSV